MSKGFFKELFELTGESLPDPSDLDMDQKIALCAHLRATGSKVTEIMEYFGCKQSNVYKMLAKSRDAEKSELECRTFYDGFIERRQMLLDQIDHYKKVQKRLRCGRKEDEEKDEDGNYVKNGKAGSARDYLDAAKIIQKYEDMLIKFEDIGGILPNADRNMFGTIEELRPETQSNEDPTEMADSDLNNLLVSQIMKGGQSLQNTSLANVKDEKIV